MIDMPRTYNLFISHAWQYNDDYYIVVNWLSQSSLDYRNYSVRELRHLMLEYVNRIMDLCLECAPGEDERNRHLMWFRKLLASHLDGIIAHATYHISVGKIEGINNKIKTLRRQAYGYRDDEYFFLKLIDMSRH